MEIKIQSIHFDATEKLQAFIEKKVAKLEKTIRRHSESRGAIESSEAGDGRQQGGEPHGRGAGQPVVRREAERHIRGKYRPLCGLYEGSTTEIQGKIEK